MPATPKQIEFISKLLDERVVPDSVRDDVWAVARAAGSSPRTDVSAVIDILLQAPKRNAGGVRAGGAGRNALVAAGIPCARYAVAVWEIDLLGHTPTLGPVLAGNDTLFVEVREFKGTRYMRQLHGAPGSYRRSKLERAQQQAVVDVLRAGTPLAATQYYARMYSICSCCGSELTETESRRLGMGPTCRTRFGL